MDGAIPGFWSDDAHLMRCWWRNNSTRSSKEIVFSPFWYVWQQVICRSIAVWEDLVKSSHFYSYFLNKTNSFSWKHVNLKHVWWLDFVAWHEISYQKNTPDPSGNDEYRVIWDTFTHLNPNVLGWMSLIVLVRTQMYLYSSTFDFKRVYSSENE